MKRALIGSFALVALSACSDGGSPRDDGPGLDVQAIDGPTADVACPMTRFVGKRTGASCPAAHVTLPASNGTWAQSLLSTSPSLPYCVYEWKVADSTKASAPQVDALPWQSERAWLAPDCHVAAPLGVSDPAGALPRAQSLDAMAAIDRVAVDSSVVPKARTRVAVIDTSPDSGGGDAVVGRSAHGYTIQRAIENVACPKTDAGEPVGTCTVETISYLAMPLTAGDVRDPKHGGWYGQQTDVASAIVRAVDDWRATKPVSTGQRLVINLSLGWESSWDVSPLYPTIGGKVGPVTLRPSATAVREALQHAACNGALVIAAVGNDGGGSAPTSDAMSPSAFTTVSIMPSSACSTEPAGFADVVPKPTTFGEYKLPVVFPVAGVDRDDKPISNARDASVTPLVAYGASVSGRVPVGSHERLLGETATTVTSAYGTVALTGTSVASAMVAATAAEVWALRPDLAPQQVMALVTNTGTTLPGITADVAWTYTGSYPAMPVRRLDHCAALTLACSGGHCGSWVPKCTPRAAFTTPATSAVTVEMLTALGNEFSAVTPTNVVVSSSTSASPAVCADDNYFAPVGIAPHCPSRQDSDVADAPFAGPQPGYPLCPSCGFGIGCKTCISVPVTGAGGSPSSGTPTPITVVGNLVAPAGVALVAPTVRVQYLDGTHTEIDLSGQMDKITPGHPFKLVVPVHRPDLVARATIHGRVQSPAGKVSTSIPLVIAH